MGTGDLLNIQPTELKFQFELRKQSSCSLQLTNKTDSYVAFKVKTTNPKKYSVRPNAGTVLPRSTCNVTVTMQGPKELPPDFQCKDKFLLQSVLVADGIATKDITPEMFNKDGSKVVDEFKLRVAYIPANPPSPVPEEPEEGSSPRASAIENGHQNHSLFDAVSRSLEGPRERSSEAWSMISKLTEEKASALRRNQKLHEELDLLRKQISTGRAGGFSLLVVLLVGLFGVLLGYFVK